MNQESMIVMEGLRGIALDLPVSERAHYCDIVMESIDTNGKEAAIIYQLFKEMQKVNDVDFGKVPESKGDITKYAYYAHMLKCIEFLSGFEAADKLESIARMNKLHTILLNYRGDFMMGYKRDIVLITTTYETMVVELNAMIDMAISDYTAYLKLNFNDRSNGKFDKRVSMLNQQVDTMIALFERGQWTMLVKAFKNASVEETTAVLNAATEASGLANMIKNIKLPEIDMSKMSEFLGVKAGRVDVGKMAGQTFSMLKKIPGQGAIKVILFIIGLLMALRFVFFEFGKLRGGMANFARNQAELLKAAMDAERDSTKSAAEKQQKMVERLEGIADMIDYKYNKADDEATREITASNKTNFGTAVVSAPVSGIDFGI